MTEYFLAPALVIFSIIVSYKERLLMCIKLKHTIVRDQGLCISRATILKTQIIINNSNNDSNSHHSPKLPSK